MNMTNYLTASAIVEKIYCVGDKESLPVCIPKQKQKVKPMKAKEYYVANAGKSWKMQMILSIEYAMKRAKTKQQFIDEMNKLGYDIRRTDTRKNITYIEKANPNHKCRDNNLHHEKFLKENMEEEFEIRERLSSLEREEQEYDFHYGESSIGNDSRKRLLENFNKLEQQSESDIEFDCRNKTGQRNGSRRIRMDCSANQEENVGTGKHDSETAEQSGNDDDGTNWVREREHAFGIRSEEEFVERTEEKMDSDILWNDDRNSSTLPDSFYFVGNLFKLINNQTKYHRKRIKLSQKEIEKRLAHGQKTDGYEEYEDYYNNELAM